MSNETIALAVAATKSLHAANDEFARYASHNNRLAAQHVEKVLRCLELRMTENERRQVAIEMSK